MMSWNIFFAVFLGILSTGILSAYSEKTVLSLIEFDSTSFNEGQPIVFEGRLTAESGSPIQEATIQIVSDGACPKDGIIAGGKTDKHGRYWIYTLTKLWDPVDNLITVYAKYAGSETLDPSTSENVKVVVYPVKSESCV
ncbi:MAG: hypothetical protein GWN01_08910 [Nitrosopumilaceae archaeon]|nr:carboxypeptidase regulatory-like domain-containing protein [Nitrosopumilaceae archaeon]NIV65511.1 hypothetical protein [Nitrosopumilaceae archaeon]NIX61630.1 hypothetical protein [Nitrosopumilaceae archaeon]